MTDIDPATVKRCIEVIRKQRHQIVIANDDVLHNFVIQKCEQSLQSLLQPAPALAYSTHSVTDSIDVDQGSEGVDLAEYWSREESWASLPKWAMWVVHEKNGEAWACREEPYISGARWWLPTAGWERIKDAHPRDRPWTEAKFQRPQVKE